MEDGDSRSGYEAQGGWRKKGRSMSEEGKGMGKHGPVIYVSYAERVDRIAHEKSGPEPCLVVDVQQVADGRVVEELDAEGELARLDRRSCWCGLTACALALEAPDTLDSHITVRAGRRNGRERGALSHAPIGEDLLRLLDAGGGRSWRMAYCGQSASTELHRSVQLAQLLVMRDLLLEPLKRRDGSIHARPEGLRARRALEGAARPQAGRERDKG